MQVVLTTDEIPHKIAPVHEVDLVAEEEPHVLRKGRTILGFLLSAVLVPYAFAFYIRPILIGLYMASLTRIHTREEHAELRHVLVTGLVAGNDVFVLLAFFFRCGSVLGMSFFLHRDTHVAFYPQLYRCIVSLTVEQRTISVLLTVEVVLETKHIIRRVLIHRSVCIGTDHECCIGTVSNEDNSHHDGSGIEPTQLFLAGVPDSPDQEGSNQYETYCETRIERTSETVDECQLEPTDQGRHTRNDTVQDYQ